MTRRILYVMVMLLTVLTAGAAYTVKQIPNVHLSSRTRYVSNPDGILSDAAVERLDTMLSRVWNTSSAEVVVVAVDDIDPDSDIQEFATDLFMEWGIGKKDKDNGLLVLIVKNQRQAVIRTGYGIE
ncbi:MAG: TPM domain-containing protein, partial [Muribaculaceae bacterium]|nr:TPM domain-containing protein [Muribaculaceae bacterium]